MTSDAIPKQEFLVRNLSTRSVTLYPTKAQVIRDITGISLKPGPNQIIIEGLTPTIDEHSIKVDGTGAATITDLSVQVIDNKENYIDIYPSDDEADAESDEEVESDKEEEKMRVITEQTKKLNVELADAREKVDSAKSRLAMLENYGKSLKDKRPDNLEKCLKEYHDEREKAYADNRVGVAKEEELLEKIQSLSKLKAKLGKTALKAKQKKQLEIIKKLAKKERKMQETRQEKAAIKAERVKFWPKKVFKVIISLDASSGSTPASSRRGSIDSMVKVAPPKETEPSSEASSVGEINLSLSYITYSASWSPRYDLSLNSVTSSGVLDYCAELKNTTCETWRDTKVVLSTSQTSYQGLGDTIPIMQPWNVRLEKRGGYGKSSSFGSSSGKAPALYSKYEQDQKVKNRSEIPAQVWKPRKELFGVDAVTYEPLHAFGGAMPQMQQMQQMQQRPVPAPSAPYSGQQMQAMGLPQLIEHSQSDAFHSTYYHAGSFGDHCSLDNPFGSQARPFSGVFGQPTAPRSSLFGNGPAPTSNGNGLFSSTAANTYTAPSLFGGNGLGSAAAPTTNTGGLFGGLNANTNTDHSLFGGPASSTNTKIGSFGSTASNANTASTLFGSTAANNNIGGLFGSAAPAPRSLFSHLNTSNSNETETSGVGTRGGGFTGHEANLRSAAAAFHGGVSGPGSNQEEDLVDYSDEEMTMANQDPALLFEESSFSDSGMTTTYDVPTLKTLAPTSTTTKHKIARVEFKGIIFSHILIPKLKAAAYLKARLRNLSKITLLKGTAGLTLDGSFLGQSTIPRCSAGDSFTLPLGVDPTISVVYAKPTVRRSQSGIFSKEDCEVFTRMAIVTNSKHNAAVELTVLDQIPVSEDERLKIEIVSPRGLRIGGESVPAGMSAQNGAGDADSVKSAAGKQRLSVYGDDGKGSGKGDGKWGSASAVAKKDGEVNWNVKINPLRGCKLMLEYEASYPGGEMVSGIN